MTRIAITEHGTLELLTEKGKLTGEEITLKALISELRSNREAASSEKKAAREAAKAERAAKTLSKAQERLAKAQAALAKAEAKQAA